MLKKTITLLTILCAITTYGFSPYENYLQSGQQKHVMLAAIAKPGSVTKLQKLIPEAANKKRALRKAKISNISAYTQKINKEEFIFIYFDYKGKSYLDAVAAFEKIPAIKELSSLVSPTPLAKDRGNIWLQMEWINFISGAQLKGKPASQFAMATRIKPEKEKEYRQLHQSTWPGIVDWMSRKGYHNFSIFVMYVGDEIYEFFYTETVATAKGSATIKNLDNDKICRRWWDNTDPCQNPLPGADGIWLMMKKVGKSDKKAK
jgi:L-rhamnose mutarotase